MKKIYDIEEAINLLTEWIKKHPELTVDKKVKDEVFGDDTALKEEYDKMRKLYGYLRAEKSKNKMSEEQIKRSKEANIGGVFGYSNEVEVLAKKWVCKEKVVLRILKEYGSVEGLYDAYVNEEISYDEFSDMVDKYSLLVDLRRIFKQYHDIEMNNSRNYNVLAEAISKSVDSRKELVYYKKSTLNTILENALTEREMKVIKLRFGLEDGKFRDLENVGRRFNCTRERIRQIEAKALRKLRHPKYKDKALTILDLDFLTEQEKEEVFEANKKLRIFDTPEEEKEKSNEIIKKYISKQQEINNNMELTKERIKQEEQRKVEEVRKENPNYDFENMNVLDFINDENISISTRLRTILGRNFTTKKIKDILSLNTSEILKIRNLGRGCFDELIGLLAAKGYKINENGYFTNKPINNKTTASDEEDNSIKMVFNTPESVKQENDILKKEIDEKQQKSKLLDELIKLFNEQEELKNKNSQLDEEIKQKLAILNQMGITYEKK